MENATETPNSWVIVKIQNDKETFYKVFASWYGGYLSGDAWKINSGITKVEEDEDYYYFNGYSGSVYKCYKEAYGIRSSFVVSVLDDIIEKSEGQMTLLENQDWTKLEL